MPSEQKSTDRTPRMNSLIQESLGEILRPYLEGLNGLVTVTKVETSKDLKWAVVWISIVGGDDEAILAEIKANIYDIQGELNSRLSTKMMPRLQFKLDTSPRYAAHINEIIEQIHKEEKTND